MPADLAALRQLTQSSPAIRAIFAALPRVRIRENTISVMKLRTHCRRSSDDTLFTHHEIATALRAIGSAGFGELLEPNVKHRAHFVWHVQPRTVADAALNPAMTLLPTDYLRAADRAALTHPVVIPDGWTPVTFPLRPEGGVTLIIPPDLTDQEAQRLGHLLRAHAQTP